MHMFVVQAQRIACLAWQSDLALVLQFQQTLLPRYIRQCFRLINKQTMQTITKIYKKSSQHNNQEHHT